MMQVNCTFVQKCSKFDAGSISINATNPEHKSSLNNRVDFFFQVGFGVPVFASFRGRVRVSSTLYGLYHLYFSAEMMVPSMRKATGRLEITMHLAECSWICLIFICDCESKNGHYYFSVLPLLPFVFHLQFISSLKKFYVNVCPIHSKTLTICFLFCVGCESFN